MPTSGEAEAYHREASALIAVISPPTMQANSPLPGCSGGGGAGHARRTEKL